MNLTLTRNRFEVYGIFGELKKESGNLICYTLEHSYDNFPKLPTGVYQCKYGLHRLANMEKPFHTFEIENVPGHTDILFHVGNYNEDSEGCVLLGKSIGNRLNGDKMLMASKNAFNEFMELLDGIEKFTLTVEDER